MTASSLARVRTVAILGIEVRPVDVEVQLGPGLPAFTIVGLPDKAVAESRERVRSALTAVGLALPPKRITVNLAPADLQKEGSHFDLPIALGVLVTLGVVPKRVVETALVLGELGLDSSLRAVAGVLPAALAALAEGRGIICPKTCGGEAAWAGAELEIAAADDLPSLVAHLNDVQALPRPEPRIVETEGAYPDLADVKGQESAKRVLEIAAAGGHNLLMIGPPGSGKSMLAQRLPGLLPPLDPAEILEVSTIASVAGQLPEGRLSTRRPYRAPHHGASTPAMVGGGPQAKPGEISLAHKGVLFLDELPEFNRPVLEALRQPLETGTISVARASVRATYPARFQLVAAMNPCRCGYADDPARACSRVPRCANDYQARLSGPLLDRIDLVIEVPPVRPQDLALPTPSEGSPAIAARVAVARQCQTARLAALGAPGLRLNVEIEGQLLDAVCERSADAETMLVRAADRLGLSARGYHRILRVARTVADLDGGKQIGTPHIAEALSHRRRALLPA